MPRDDLDVGDRSSQADILRLQRADDAPRDRVPRAIENGNVVDRESSVDFGSLRHLDEVTEQTESGDVRARCRAVLEEARGSRSIRAPISAAISVSLILNAVAGAERIG